MKGYNIAMNLAVASAQQLYQGRLDYLEALFETEYKGKCLDVQSIEAFRVNYTTTS